jgi:hypothetical protein
MPESYSHIFLLSHMRAFTSLAGHILGSHPEINGYFELHISYDDAAALDRQLAVLQQYETLKQDSRYLFDKLLHNGYRLDPSRLAPDSTRLLVCLRRPQQTLQSIVGLFEKKGTAEPYASPTTAADYYIDRLETLAGFCRSSSLPYCYYDAELFQAAPEVLLARLGDWLALGSPLSQRYQRFSQTGKARKGDSSSAIYSGRIEQDRVDYSHIRIPDDALRRAREVYGRCREGIVAGAAGSVVMPAGTPSR